MKSLPALFLILFCGCVGISGMLGTSQSLDTVSFPDTLADIPKLAQVTAFSASPLSGERPYPDCGGYLTDYDTAYTFGKSCRVYEQEGSEKSIYAFYFSVPVYLYEFSNMFSSIRKFSPTVQNADQAGKNVIIFDNRLRLAYIFQCSSNLVLMVSADLSKPQQDELSLQGLTSNIIDYCESHRII